MSKLKVVVFDNHLQQPIGQTATFICSHLIDSSGVHPSAVQTLPSGHWVGSHHGVDGAEIAAYIVWRTTGLYMNLRLLLLGRLVVTWLRKCGRQGLQKSPIRG